MKLTGQIVVVTGAGRGIGREIALAHAEVGAKVALIARTAAEIESVSAMINSHGGVAHHYTADIINFTSVTKAFGAIESELGPVDLLINNAGAFGAIGPIWEVDPQIWWQDIETNVRGSFNCCRAVLPQMRARKRGRIINMTGGGTATSFPNGSGYATSKAGLLRFTECVGDTLTGSGVLVFAMDPGLVRTKMTEYQLTSAAGQAYLPGIQRLFDENIDVSPKLAAKLSVEIGSGRFDRLAGRMLMAARGDLELSAAAVDEIVASDFRSLRVNGMPPERSTRIKG